MKTLWLALAVVQDDPVAAAMEKIAKALAETPAINLARAAEIVKVILNEGTFLESQKKHKERAEVYAKSADAFAKALEAQPTRSGPQRKCVLALQKAAKRAERKKTDEGRAGSYQYAFRRVALAFQVEQAEVRELVVIGLDCLRAGHLEEAEESLREAEERLPAILGKNRETTDKNARLAAMLLAQTHLAAGRYADGGAAARRAIDLVPDFGDETIHLRDLYENGENYDSSIRKLDEHVGKNPSDLEARFLLGFQLYFSPDRAKSKAIFRSLCEKNADDAGAKYFLERLR